jgi:hypothetical protein
MWTMQEIVLAKDAVILCGDKSVSWAAFGKAFESVLGIRTPHHNPFNQDEAETSILRHITGFQAQWELSSNLKVHHRHNRTGAERFSSSEKQRLLMRALSNARSLQCQDARDKIYALYWMISDLSNSFPAPDYSKSSETVFHEAAMAVLETTGPSTWLFSLVNGGSRSLGLPSWVPDWSDCNPFSLPDSEGFYASGKSTARGMASALSAEGHKLQLFGKTVSTIRWTSENLERPWEKISVKTYNVELEDATAFLGLLLADSSPEDFYAVLLDNIDDPRQFFFTSKTKNVTFPLTNAKSLQPTFTGTHGEPAIHAIEESWVIEEPKRSRHRSRQRRSTDDWFRNRRRVLFGLMILYTAANRGFRKIVPKKQTAREESNKSLSELSIEEKVTTFLSDNCIPSENLNDPFWGQALGSRRFQMIMFLLLCQWSGENDFKFRLYNELSRSAFFVTESGRLGTAFHTAQKGDVVVLLEEATRPMVVRPAGQGEWTFVGPAYVHGIMQGQAWPGDNNQLDKFTLV